jgi:hypothetical protein
MDDRLSGLRDIRRSMLRPGAAEHGVVVRAHDHEERLAAHEQRIHNHPCPCGSGKRYVDCCIGRANQGQLELRHRCRMGLRNEDL